jgi:hypothetical protein
LSNFTAYNSRFRMPSEESGGVMNMWHSCVHHEHLPVLSLLPLTPPCLGSTTGPCTS